MQEQIKKLISKLQGVDNELAIVEVEHNDQEDKLDEVCGHINQAVLILRTLSKN